MSSSDAAVSIEGRLGELGLELPPAVALSGNYLKAVSGNYLKAARSGNLLFLSGHLPDTSGDPIHVGKLGRDLTTEQGYAAARQAGLSMLASIRDALGDLDRVVAVLKLFGMVNCTDDFTEQPQVVNGASDLLFEVFGDIGLHARSAVGMAQLPRNNCVELEAVVEVADV